MGAVAEKLKGKGQRSGRKDKLDPILLSKRIQSGSNHFRQLASIADQVDTEDYNEIRESILPVAELIMKAFEKPKNMSKAEKDAKATEVMAS